MSTSRWKWMLAGVPCLVAALANAQQYPPPENGPAPMNAPPSNVRAFTPAETLAVVGDQHILAGDLLGDINQMLAPYVGKAPPEELEEQRQRLLKQYLPSAVENKILYLEF